MIPERDGEERFGVYYAVPVVRKDALKRHPDLGTALTKLGGTITEREISEMTLRADQATEGHIERVEEIAEHFLRKKKLIG